MIRSHVLGQYCRIWYDPAEKGEAMKLDYSVAKSLKDSANLLRSVTSPAGIGLALWERRGGRDLSYRRPAHHTISLYLRGGNYVRHITDGAGLRGKSNVSGSPGAICIMPAGCETRWDNRGYVRWLHIYFRDEHMQQATSGMTDCPTELVFGCDPAFREMAERFVLALDWTAANDRLALDHALYALLARSLEIKRTTATFRAPSGGLTGAQCQALEDAVAASLEKRITVADLAEIAGLSSRQLSRAFPVSYGMPPYEWVLRRRLDAARSLLDQGREALDVAAACGFSSQSHMIRRFRATFGYTPGAMR
ncbi:helix-turn-helix transcriptional regulator [uncultured Roseobacter sp.]|uniref:helix-turn-helix domain-containing protein n=1 Tax=uncultured Roseobacter sp. TaxID=114847 RepID=UPI00261E22C5|nr:helix-turn-helix transcriptional regulator [uncultured Roseobacter sp.]